MNAVIIQTCDKYEFLWEGWWYYFKKYWDWSISWPVYFCTELKCPKNINNGNIFMTGKGEWGERLRLIISTLTLGKHDLFYMQEDFWLHRTLPVTVFNARYKTFKDWNMNAYRCCPVSKYFQFTNKYPPFLFSKESPYLITHQASFWKAQYFYDNILPHEDPWTNEKAGTKRIAAFEKADTQIYLSPFNWYHTVCLKGKLTELGSDLNEQAKNS